ncbi:MAG: sugar kinase, partial [Bacteroidota bacterium]|nr:sugar kinase [Bacteroidota bacterium]
VPVPAVVDSTGCGDVFGSTFAYFLALGDAPIDAAVRAVRAGAFTVTIPGSHGMERLHDVVWGEDRCAFS